MRREILIEMFLVGILVVIFQYFTYYVVSGEFPQKHLKSMILGGFLVGASLHFFLEIIGANEKWCRMTYK